MKNGLTKDACDECAIELWNDQPQRVEGRPLLCVECNHRAKQYPTDPAGELDALGIEAPRRPKPCLKRTWCLLTADHEGSCVEVPRRKER